MTPGITIGELLQSARVAHGVPDWARDDAPLLLGYVLHCSRATLLAHPERRLPAPEVARFHALLARRAGGEPLAYITGEKEFWSLRLQVSPAVLVPRPETELVVERALALLPAAPQDVADLGTGSGAIALALAHERPAWRLTATDVSAAALAQARENAAQLGLRKVRFIEGSWFAPLRSTHPVQRFHAIVSNPPYVAAEDEALALLRHEPRGALAARHDGYGDLASLVAGAPQHLHPGGWLVLEHGFMQAKRLAELLVGRGFARVVCHPDLAGHPRVTEAQWPMGEQATA